MERWTKYTKHDIRKWTKRFGWVMIDKYNERYTLIIDNKMVSRSNSKEDLKEVLNNIIEDLDYTPKALY